MNPKDTHEFVTSTWSTHLFCGPYHPYEFHRSVLALYRPLTGDPEWKCHCGSYPHRRSRCNRPAPEPVDLSCLIVQLGHNATRLRDILPTDTCDAETGIRNNINFS